MTPIGELTCRELVELVTEYLEGAMPAGARARFEAHLASCPPCRRYLDQMRLTRSALGHLRDEDVSPDTLAALGSLFRRWQAG